jgi:hypothetical protein
MIRDVARFEQELLLEQFRHKKLSSFVRQLNMYDFHKLRSKEFKMVFKHKYFRRLFPELLPLVKKACAEKGGQQHLE